MGAVQKKINWETAIGLSLLTAATVAAFSFLPPPFSVYVGTLIGGIGGGVALTAFVVNLFVNKGIRNCTKTIGRLDRFLVKWGGEH